MHFVFIPYGKRSEVELLLRDMEAQKHYLKFKEGSGTWIQGQVRFLPFGVYEYVFPREDLDAVLRTLDLEDRYKLGKFIMKVIRKMLRLKPIPTFKTDKQYLWVKDNVNLIPLGIREDTDIFDKLVNATHEAI